MITTSSKTVSERRIGHKSCGTCRALKLRCVREDDDQPCRRCTRRGEQCKTPEYRRPKSRTGSRIELARTLFGQLHEYGTTTRSSTPPLNPSSPEEVQVDAQEPVDLVHLDHREAGNESWSLSETSTETSLSRRETHGWLSSHLVEECFVAVQYPQPIGRWKDFRTEFEEAGRRPEQLASPMLEVLATVLMAYGALVTDAPCVVGRDLVASKRHRESSRDLAAWGQRRSRMCEELKERAVRITDEKSAFRCESVEGISVLIMLSALLDHGDVQRRKGRPYRMAAVAHAKTIAEDRERTKDWTDVVDGPLGWMLYLTDAWTSASAGTLPLMSEADVHAICPNVEVELGLPSIDDVSRAMNGECKIWVPVRRVWAFAARLIHQLIPYLRQRPDDSELAVLAEGGLYESPSVLGEAFKELDEMKKCASTVQSILTQFLTFRRPGYGLLRHYFVALPIARTFVTFTIHRGVACWIEPFPTADRNSSDFRWVALSKVQEESTKHMIEVAREVAQMLHAFLEMLPCQTSIALGAGMTMIYAMLPMLAEYLCAAPTKEDCFATSYTLNQKREELSWFLEGLYYFAWACADTSLRDATVLLERKLSEDQFSSSHVNCSPPVCIAQGSPAKYLVAEARTR